VPTEEAEETPTRVHLHRLVVPHRCGRGDGDGSSICLCGRIFFIIDLYRALTSIWSGCVHIITETNLVSRVDFVRVVVGLSKRWR
jgi:hypothetical protein